MLPVAYPVDLEQLGRLWQSFMEGSELDPEALATLDPAVVQSWRRCYPRLDAFVTPRPRRIGAHVLDSLLRAQASLVVMATPFMEDIHQFIEGSNCAILLTDGTACVLQVSGDPAPVASIEQAGLGQGTYWAEGQLGTNALALALATAMPVQVVGPEHYFRGYRHLTTTAAPIHDVRGRIIGVIGIVGPAEQSTPHTLALVMAAARAISSHLHTDLYLDEANLHLSEVNTILGAISEGVIAWDASGKVHHINAQAGEILHLSPAAIVGRYLEDVLLLPPPLDEAVRYGLELRDVESTFQLDAQAITCLASLRPIGAAAAAGGGPATARQPVGFIAMLRPMEHVRQLVQQQIGATAALSLEELDSESVKMRQVLRQARIAARGEAPVLIRGEGGVGKNHLARAIHNDSRRAHKPLLVIDCRAIPHELMASELLGHEIGPGGDGRPSKFELANGGTLLLDQVESLSLELQTVLLRVLETSHVMRLGGTRAIPLDLRIIALTTGNLEERVAEGSFVSHLYYRFGVFNIAIPPLRERVDDIPLLAERFLARLSQRDDRPYWLDSEALKVLGRYPWPGNVREMESALERALSHSRDGVIRLVDLPDVVRSGRVVTPGSPQPRPVLTVADAEREAIIRAGMACHGRVGEMARQLGIGRTTLWRKMKRLNVSPADFIVR